MQVEEGEITIPNVGSGSTEPRIIVAESKKKSKVTSTNDDNSASIDENSTTSPQRPRRESRRVPTFLRDFEC